MIEYIKLKITEYENLILKISKTFIIATLILTIIKIFFGLFSPIVNFTLLFTFFIISYIGNLYEKVEHLMTKTLQRLLSEGILDYRDETYDTFIFLWKGDEKMQKEFQDLKDKNTWYNKMTLNIFIRLIQIRLLLLMEPLIYSFLYFFVIYWLIFNKFVVFTQLISLIITISKLCYNLNMYSNKFLKSTLNMFSDEEISDEKNLKPTYKNAIIITHIILSTVNELNYALYQIIREENFTELNFCGYKDILFIHILLEEYFINNNNNNNILVKHTLEYRHMLLSRFKNKT